MESFNTIAARAHTDDDESFYTNRGIKIHSLEVTSYACSDKSTAAVLEQIIMETTNRMNRLSKQDSENEVAISKIQGQIEQENRKSELLAVEQAHAVEAARAEGTAEAERCVAFLKTVREAESNGKTESLPEELWHALRKQDALKAVAAGNATVYFTPQDAHLTIENR